MPAFNPLPKPAAEGFAGWAGHGRKEAVRTTVPVRVVDLAWDSIPDSKVSGDLSFASMDFALNRLSGKGGRFTVARAYAILSDIEPSPAY